MEYKFFILAMLTGFFKVRSIKSELELESWNLSRFHHKNPAYEVLVMYVCDTEIVGTPKT